MAWHLFLSNWKVQDPPRIYELWPATLPPISHVPRCLMTFDTYGSGEIWSPTVDTQEMLEPVILRVHYMKWININFNDCVKLSYPRYSTPQTGLMLILHFHKCCNLENISMVHELLLQTYTIESWRLEPKNWCFRWCFSFSRQGNIFFLGSSR